jgi:hypothetical protein
MFTNRISKIVLVLLALAVVLVSVSFATYSSDRSHVAFHGNAAREYQLGERYGQSPQQFTENKAAREFQLGERYGQIPSELVIDSATRSYTTQAKAIACGVDATYGLNLDSATRSYIAWALALQAKNDSRALCR